MLWTWAQLETQVVTIVVTRQEIRAYVDGRFIVSARQPGGDGSIGLHLGLGDYLASDPRLPAVVRYGMIFLRESSWGSVVVRSLDGEILSRERFAFLPFRFLPGAPKTDAATVAEPGELEYIVEATLLRPRDPAGVVVNDDGEAGVLFFFRPEHRDSGIFVGDANGPRLQLERSPHLRYRKALPAALQDVLRLLLSAYPLALGVTLLAVGARRIGTRRPPTSERSVRSTDSPSPQRVGSLDRPSQRARSARRGGLAVWAIVGALAVATLAIAGYVAYAILERMPHVQDSVAYLFQAKVFARGQLWAPLPARPEFFEHEFLIQRDGRWFAKYPPGFPAILALGVIVGAPWLVNPVCAALSIVLVFLIGRRLAGTPTGLIAAALAVTSPFLIFLSGSFMSHPAGLLMALLFAWLFLRREHPASALGAGIALGIGLLVRPWTMAAIAAPFGIVALAELARERERALRRYSPLLVGLLPFVAAWFGYNAALTGDPLRTTMELGWSFDRVGFGPDRGPFGFWPGDGLANTSRNLGLLLKHLFGWPWLATLFFVTLPFVSGRDRRGDELLLASFVSLVLGYLVWWADGVMYGPRFLYEGIGLLFVLSARGVVELASLARQALVDLGVRASRPVGTTLAAAVLALLVAFNVGIYLPPQLASHRGYNFVNRSSLDAVESAGLRRAIVFTDSGESFAWWWYGMVFSANSPFLDSDVVFARDLGPERNAELIAQFPDREPYQLAGTELRPLRESD